MFLCMSYYIFFENCTFEHNDVSTLEIRFFSFPCFAVFVFVFFWLAFLKMIYCCRLSLW